MGKVRVKQTPNQRAWRQEARRINMSINELKERGFAFHEEAYVKYNPKRVTKKALARIRSVTPEQIINQAMLENPSTGKYEYASLNVKTGEVKFKGTTLKGGLSTWQTLNDKAEYKKATQPADDMSPDTEEYAYAYEIIVGNFIKYFDNSKKVWDNETRGWQFIAMIKEAMSKYSAYQVAKALNDAEVMVGIPTYPELYYDWGIARCEEYMRHFWDLLGASDKTKDRWEEALNDTEYWWDTDNEE